MKIILLSILLFGCTASRVSNQKLVTLDASESKITGGDGNGKIVSWVWKDLTSNKIIGFAPTISIITGTGNYEYQLKVTDNLGNKDSAILKVEVK